MYITQTFTHTPHYLVIGHSCYRLPDQRRRIDLKSLEESLEHQLLVSGLDQREVALDAIEVGTVGHVEDEGDIKPLTDLLNLFRFVDREIIEKQSERLIL